MKNAIEISTSTLVKAIVILLAGWFVYLTRDVIALLFISIIIVSAIDPLVDWFQRKRIPRPAGVLIIYLIIFLLISLALSFLIPPLTNQLSDFAKNYPLYYQKTQNVLNPIISFFQTQHIDINAQNFLDNISGWLSGLSSNIFSTTIGVFSGLISFVAVLSMAFYMAMSKDSLKNFVASVVPGKHKIYAADLAIRIKQKIGRWMQGQLMLMAIIFVIDFIGLSLIGIPYPLVLAALAGLLEIVPYVGPIIAAVPGVVLGFIISPVKGLLALALYVFTQQAENNLIVPIIMKKAVDLSPVVVILVLLIGAKLGGIMGAILAVPIATAAGMVIKDLFFKDNEKIAT